MKFTGRFSGLLGLACLLFPLIASAQVGSAAPLFEPVRFGEEGVRLADRPADIVTESKPVRFNAGQMLKLKHGELARLEIPGLAARDVVFELAESHGDGIHSWVGYLK